MPDALMAIDPGLKGAIVVRTEDGELIPWQLKHVDYEIFAGILREYNVKHVFLEKAQVMNRRGVRPAAVAMFNYGTGFGKLQGWIEAMAVPMTMFAPVTWTKEMHVGCVGKTAKDKSQVAMKRLFPRVDFVISHAKKPHDGMVDAALILEFGRRKYVSGSHTQFAATKEQEESYEYEY